MISRNLFVTKKLLIFILTFAYILNGYSVTTTYGAGACTAIPNSQTCLDSTPCKLDSAGTSVCLAGATPPDGGVNTTLTCWQYSYDYACTSPGDNNCATYQSDPNCAVINSTCQSTIPATGTCDSWNVNYRCGVPTAASATVSCASGLFDSTQFATPAVSNVNFGKTVAAMEVMREAEVYSASGTDIFKGVKETCDQGYYGIKECCKSLPGAKSNAAASAFAFSAAASVVKYAGANAINYASPYVYDAMYSVSEWAAELTGTVSAMGCNAPTSIPTDLSISAFGFTYSTGTFQAGSGLMGANSQVTSFGPGGGFLEFNPYMLAAQLVIMYVQSLAQCTADEQLLGMHKGANLSHYLDTQCTAANLGTAQVCTQSYCSFNSVLAKIINIQGKPQLGLDISDCSGLSINQISQIDFQAIDFSEFTSQVTSDALSNQPSNSTINTSYTPIMTTTTKGSSQSTVKPVTPAYP